MRLSAPRLTAQLVLSESEAYLAYCGKRDPRGPCGEAEIAMILHSRDAGASWIQIPWRRSLWSRLRHPGFPTWPPEAVMKLEHTRQGLRITHRDEWVPFEPGGESLWESTWVDGGWRPTRLRRMDYEGEDSPIPQREIPFDLPPGMRPPRLGTVATVAAKRAAPASQCP